MKKYKSIVLTGGGTMGHVTPNLSILPELMNNFENIFYIGSYNGIEKDKIASFNKKLRPSQKRVEYIGIPTVKVDRVKWYKNFTVPFKLLKGIREAKHALRHANPDVVFSKGGFVAVPVVIASHQLHIPVVIHESDLSLGLANKVSAKFATTVCTTFPETAKKTVNGIYTGSPINSKLFLGDANRTKEKYKLHPALKTITITGGSLGSEPINNAILEVLPYLTLKYNVIHLTGKGKKVNFKHANYHQLEFSDDIGSIFKASDLVISRAGSNTIFELASLKIPMLLIPLPKSASRGDQIDNANYFQSLGIANVIAQENLPFAFKESIEETIQNLHKYKKELNRLTFPDGKSKIINEIYKAVDKKPELKKWYWNNVFTML